MSNLGERKKKMMEDAHVCMCRACIYRCVHARLQGVGNKTINPVTSAENENQCSAAFTWWCQPRGPWWHSRWRPLTQVTNHRTHCTASRGVGSPPPPRRLLADQSRKQPLLHPQHSPTLCTHRTWCSESQDMTGYLGALVLGYCE